MYLCNISLENTAFDDLGSVIVCRMLVVMTALITFMIREHVSDGSVDFNEVYIASL